MQVGKWQFSIPWWALLLYVVIAALMVRLGLWQLDRAETQKSRQQQAAIAALSPALPLAGVTDYEQAAENYQRVWLEGAYLHERQLLWDNRTHKGMAGFDVITPIKLDSGELALINRGWTAPGQSRQMLPDISLATDLHGLRIRLEGFASSPSKGLASGPALDPEESQWPRILQYLDYPAIEDVYGKPVIPLLIEVQSVMAHSLEATVPTPRPEWLVANWQPGASGPAKHYSYAFQWFAMAVGLTAITIIVNLRKQEN